MNIQSLIGKFKRNNQARNTLTVVIQPSELYFSQLTGVDIPSKVSVEDGSWQGTLRSCLDNIELPHLTLDVVLNSKLYQTYQIEKPNIPPTELSGALPFLLKDLISEKVTDIIADSAELPGGNKLQVYVVVKSLIIELQQMLLTLDVQLGRVLVEDEVWGVSAAELGSFLLLQRSKQRSFRVSAYVEHHCAFQRTMRGIASPLTGVATSVLQLDGIALELQRSIDYLSSQLRGSSLHKMKVCCDEEELQELVEALNERLNVSVASLTEEQCDSGEVLIKFVSHLSANAINLYPDSIKPKTEHLTLANIAIGWAAVGGFLLTMFGYLYFQHTQLNNELQHYAKQQQQAEQKLAELNKRLAKHKPSAAKIAAVERLKADIQGTRASLKAVAEFDKSQQMGYSGVMKALAKLGRQDISLNSIFIDANTMDLQGLAREPRAIPNWVSQFQSDINLVGRTFEQLRIGRNDQDIVTFELITQRENK